MRKFLLKFFVLIAVIIAIPLLYYQESRYFYCLPNDKCVTVWKRIGGICYVIPGKYYGITKPKNNYIQTTNLGDIDIIFLGGRNIIVTTDSETRITNNDTKSGVILDYAKEKNHNDSLYLNWDGNYHRYKKEVDYMSINIKEGYAIDKNGKKL